MEALLIQNAVTIIIVFRYECHKAEYVTKLASGKHSTKGCGVTFPEPTQSTELGGIEVPSGKPQTSTAVSSSLLYNEFIVYDIAQVEVKYLLKMKFDYKSFCSPKL